MGNEISVETCSKELSLKLKELGITKCAFMCHMVEGAVGVNTYTTCELGKMLPKIIKVNNYPFVLTMVYHEDMWYVQYLNLSDTGDGGYQHTIANTESDIIEADARAKMLIWLIENKHVTVDEINSSK